MRILAVDPGGRRIGLALGDVATGVATPLAVVEIADRAAAVRAIAGAVEEFGATRVVIGLPTDLDGGETAACARSRAIAGELEKLGFATALQPEALTSDEARRRARALGRRADRPVDDLAAQIILEEHLAGAAGGQR